MKDVLVLGLNSEHGPIYEEQIEKLTAALRIVDDKKQDGFKSLMNYLLTLEDPQNGMSINDFGVTNRCAYLAIYKALEKQGLPKGMIEKLFFFDAEGVNIHSTPDFVKALGRVVHESFSTLADYLEADDDVERFTTVIDSFSQYLIEKNDPLKMVKFFRNAARLCDSAYVTGYGKANDGWGGKLDLDQEIYPAFFRDFINQELAPFNFPEYVLHFLYLRMFEVGKPQTVLVELYWFINLLEESETLKAQLLDQDKILQEAIARAQGGSENGGSTRQQRAAIVQMAEYVALQGRVYDVFDKAHLKRVMESKNYGQFYDYVAGLMDKNPPKIAHFLTYAFAKLLRAPRFSAEITEGSIAMFLEQNRKNIDTFFSDELLENLPEQYRGRIPDMEVRFFLNRIMTNMNTFERFQSIQSHFRQILIDQSDFPLIHEIFIERASEGNHASALMSFYIAALLNREFGEFLPQQIIGMLAGRLALTYSFTRRFALYYELKQIKIQYSGTTEDTENLEFFGMEQQDKTDKKAVALKDRSINEQWIILYRLINDKELELALNLIDEQFLFEDILTKTEGDKLTALAEAKEDLIQKVHNIIDDKFIYLFDDSEEKEKKELEAKGTFPAAYYGKYEKVRSIIIAQFIASGWDVEVRERKRKGKNPLLPWSQNFLLRSIRSIDVERIREQYEYKEARENIDINTLTKQVDVREEMFRFITRSVTRDLEAQKFRHRLTEEALAIMSHTSTALRGEQLKVELGIKQLVERLKADLQNRSSFPLDQLLRDCMNAKYGKVDVKIYKKDADGNLVMDPATGEPAEKTHTITPEKFPEKLQPAREEIERLSKEDLYQIYYLVVLHSIVSETAGSMTFIREALATNKYVVAADALKEQQIENEEIIDYARAKIQAAKELAPFEMNLAALAVEV